MCEPYQMKPCDRVDLALTKLRAIDELILCIANAKGDFHILDPENFVSLLGGIYDELSAAWNLEQGGKQ